jgi:GMP synthase-like glutamine amidotransferase
MTEARANSLLVIQGRLNTSVIEKEQENLRNMAKRTGMELMFANPLSDNTTTPWDKPDALLHKYGGSMWLGSSDFDLDIPTNMRDRYLNRAMPLAQKILDEGESALGICMGHQVFSAAAGEKVHKIADRREVGTVQLDLTEQGQDDPLLSGLPPKFKMIYGHNYSVASMPKGFTRLGKTERDANSALRKDNVATFQGHPEIYDAKDVESRVEASKGTSNEYLKTHPFEDPYPTQIIVINFFNEVKKSR